MDPFWRLLVCSLAITGTASLAGQTQKSHPYPDTVSSNLPMPERVKLSNGVPGLAPPTLIPKPLPPLASHCNGKKADGGARFSLVVDSNGYPRNVIFERALGKDLDLLALHILFESRFHPAMLGGSPVAVGREAETRLEVCVEETKDPSGALHHSVRLRSPQDERFSDWHHSSSEANLAPMDMPPDAQADHEHPGTDFTLPKTIMERSIDAKGMSGSFLFGVLVDERGITHVEKVLKSTNSALLPIAAAMVSTIRQTPATKDGMPVPVHLTQGLTVKSDSTN
jgi:hypothetical protein